MQEERPVTCMILDTVIWRNLRTSSENIPRRRQLQIAEGGGGGFVINNVDNKDYDSCVHFELALHSDCAYPCSFLG